MLPILFGYKGVLQISALFFAFQIRKVKVKGLNDAKYITSVVYIISIILAMLLVTSFGLREYVNIYAAIFSGGLFFGTTALLVIVYVPKV